MGGPDMKKNTTPKYPQYIEDLYKILETFGKDVRAALQLWYSKLPLQERAHLEKMFQENCLATAALSRQIGSILSELIIFKIDNPL